jgi:hypothetical protein
MSDPFKEFVAEMARLAVPEDDSEECRARREAAVSESGTPTSKLDDSDLLGCANDEFLTLWAMIRKRAGADRANPAGRTAAQQKKRSSNPSSG